MSIRTRPGIDPLIATMRIYTGCQKKSLGCLGIIILLLTSHVRTRAQDYTWWNEANNWDYMTHWSKYIQIAPAHMGPNALPVPLSIKGRIITEDRLWLRADGHWDTGDQTYNLFARWEVSVSDRVSFRVSMVPVEYYQTDEATRDRMSSRDEDSRGLSVGDLYIGTDIQIVRDHANWPDLALSVNLKTASGNNFFAARFTDTPGYSFDLSAGDQLIDGEQFQLRWFANAGLYVWQTNREDYFQNDAFLYAGGLIFHWDKLQISPSLAGYYGYIGEGDRPVLARVETELQASDHWTYTLLLQQGLNDYPYFSSGVGLRYRFSGSLLR